MNLEGVEQPPWSARAGAEKNYAGAGDRPASPRLCNHRTFALLCSPCAVAAARKPAAADALKPLGAAGLLCRIAARASPAGRGRRDGRACAAVPPCRAATPPRHYCLVEGYRGEGTAGQAAEGPQPESRQAFRRPRLLSPASTTSNSPAWRMCPQPLHRQAADRRPPRLVPATAPARSAVGLNPARHTGRGPPTSQPHPSRTEGPTVWVAPPRARPPVRGASHPSPFSCGPTS